MKIYIKERLKYLHNQYEKYPIIGTTFVFVTVVLLYASVYLNNQGVLYTDDHFFHFKYAYLIRTQGWDVVKNFKWISIGPGISGTYQLTLYNLAVIPFTFFGDMLTGLKITDIFFASSCVGAIYYFLRKFEIKFPLLWVLFLISVPYFAGRMLSGRAFVLVPAFLIAELYFAKERRYTKLFIVSMLHVSWHTSTFFLPIVVTLIVEASRILAGMRIYWKNIAASLMGFFIGVNLTLYSIKELIKGTIGIQLFVTKNATNAAVVKIEGSELYPVDIFRIITDSNVALFFLIVGFSVVIYYYVATLDKKNDLKISNEDKVLLYSVFLLSLMSLSGSLMISGRFYDFYYTSLIFLASSVITVLMKNKELFIGSKIKKNIIFGMTLFAAILVFNNFLNIRHEVINTDFSPTRDVAKWVELRSTADDRVFLNDWGLFPVAFFYNSKGNYNIGIEPRGALNANPELYWKWYNIFVYRIYCDQPRDCLVEKENLAAKINSSDNNEQEKIKKDNSRKIIESIKKDFGSKFIITTSQLSNVLDMNPELIADSIKVESDIDGSVIKGYELK